MAIARKPQAEPTANQFIEAAQPAHRNPLFPITLRIEQDFLNRIDAAAKRRNITRSAWIKNTLSKALEK